jgi:hypothetical protein
MTTTGVALSEMYEHAIPDSPLGTGVAPAAGVTTVGAGRVVPRALPTVDAEGHEPVAMAEFVAGVGVGAVDAGVAVPPPGADEPEDGVVEEEPQAASSAAASDPASSVGRVVRRDTGGPPPIALLSPGRWSPNRPDSTGFRRP